MISYLLTPPTAEPVSVADAKFAARADGAHWDGAVAAAITAARQVAEHETGRRLMTQVWRYELGDWPAADELLPELRPTAVTVARWNGTQWQALEAGAFVWAPAGPTGWHIALAPALGTTWPDLGEVALGPRVRVDVTVGAASAADVPAPAVQFIKAMVALMLNDPTLTAEAALDGHKYLRHVLDPIRLYR